MIMTTCSPLILPACLVQLVMLFASPSLCTPLCPAPQLYSELNHMEGISDQFAFDLLVEAVAFSQNKFDFTRDDIRAKLRDAAHKREVSQGGREGQLWT